MTRNNGVVSIDWLSAEHDMLLQELAARRPWIFVGYDARIENTWRSQRQDLITIVDRRREEIERIAVQVPQPSEPSPGEAAAPSVSPYDIG